MKDWEWGGGAGERSEEKESQGKTYPSVIASLQMRWTFKETGKSYKDCVSSYILLNHGYNIWQERVKGNPTH